MRTHETGRAPGGREPHACAPPGPSPFPPPRLCPRPRSAARARPPPPQSQACHGYPPTPTAQRARSRSPASAPPPPPRPTRVRVTLGNRRCVHRRLCACVPPARPSLPLGRFPSPAQLRESGERGVAPSPQEVSIDRLFPAPPCRHRPAAAAAAAAPAPRQPAGSARPGLLAAPAPRSPACTPRRARSGGSRRDALGGRCLTSSAARPGQGRSQEPAPAAPPMGRRPRSLRPRIAPRGSRLKDRDGCAREVRRGPRCDQSSPAHLAVPAGGSAGAGEGRRHLSQWELV